MAISFKRHTLDNGLRLLVHEDSTSQLAACNITYNVGSRDEHPDRTGLAHLMEHFMFCGSKHIPDYDTPLQKAGAINNAYTSQDLTQYYIVLPALNLETAFWIESDRMLELAFNQQSLDIQKHVVIEEFKETCLNRPFGNLWSTYTDLTYEKYPYKWMPAGKDPSHIEGVTMDIIRDFHSRYYSPANAVIVVGGPVPFDEVVRGVEKWFGDIPARPKPDKVFPEEPEQTCRKVLRTHGNAPYPMLVKGWKMPPRLHPDFYAYDLLSDLFGNAQASYLYKKFVAKSQLFTDISMTVSGTSGPGLLSIVARPADGTDIEAANAALDDFLYHDFAFGESFSYDLQKLKNYNEARLLKEEVKLENRTALLSVEETLGDAEDLEQALQYYNAVTEEQIRRVWTDSVREERENTLFYLP